MLAATGDLSAGSETIVRVSQTSYFFVAPDDQVAVSALSRSVDQVDPAFVFAKKIDPFDAIPALEALLTGRLIDDVNPIKPLVVDDGGEAFIGVINRPLAEALAAATSDQLAEVASRWSCIEAFEGRAWAADLIAGLNELADLIRRAQHKGCNAYGLFVAV